MLPKAANLQIFLVYRQRRAIDSKVINEPFELSEGQGQHYPLATVQDIVKRIHASEYKRRQSASSLRVSEKSFSIGRRFPIVQRWV